jgi:hypothetical protein
VYPIDSIDDDEMIDVRHPYQVYFPPSVKSLVAIGFTPTSPMQVEMAWQRNMACRAVYVPQKLVREHRRPAVPVPRLLVNPDNGFSDVAPGMTVHALLAHVRLPQSMFDWFGNDTSDGLLNGMTLIPNRIRALLPVVSPATASLHALAPAFAGTHCDSVCRNGVWYWQWSILFHVWPPVTTPSVLVTLLSSK